MGRNLIPQQKCQRIRNQRLFGWWANRLKVEIVPVDAIADALHVVPFFHQFVFVVVLTGSKEADDQEQGEWVT